MKRVKIRGFKAKKHTIPLDKKSLSKIKRKQRLWTRFLNTRDSEIYTEYCQVFFITRCSVFPLVGIKVRYANFGFSFWLWLFPELFGVTFHLGCNPFLMLSCDFSSYISNLISHLRPDKVEKKLKDWKYQNHQGQITFTHEYWGNLVRYYRHHCL
jgi:hypothetical protein